MSKRLRSAERVRIGTSLQSVTFCHGSLIVVATRGCRSSGKRSKISMSFVMVLVLSLMMLVPLMSQRIVGFQLMVLGGVFLVFTGRLLLVTKGQGHADFSIKLFRRRLILPLFGYLWVALTGYLLFSGSPPPSLNLIIGAVCTILGNASGTSWDLLVRVARIRRSDLGDETAG